MEILYAGAGLHFDILNHFKDCNNFVLLDSKPCNDYGFDNYYNESTHNHNFVSNMNNILGKIGFTFQDKTILTKTFLGVKKDNLEAARMVFKEEAKTNHQERQRILNYYISTCIPAHLSIPTLQHDMQRCNTLLISGHFPDARILNYLAKPFTFIGYTGTCYPKPESLELEQMKPEDDNNLINLIVNTHLAKEYILVDNETGQKEYFPNYKGFYARWVETIIRHD